MKESRDSKYSDLESNLSAIGKEVFVTFYYDFKNFSVSMEELSDKLFKENKRSKSKNQNFRIPRARHIFETGQQIEALRLILKSKRLSKDIIEQAEKIIKREENAVAFGNDHIEEQIFIKQISELQENPENEKIFEYENIAKKPKGVTEKGYVFYKRDRKVALNALSKAKHLCEVDEEHFVFLRKNGSVFYTEPHHLVPLSAWRDFQDVDLVREQNIVSLCSNCHNFLHYGADIDAILKPLYDKRKDLLKKIGIEISYEKLREYYL